MMSIIILPADRGRATVVMDCSDYSAKMLAMLGDRDIYQLMVKDPTNHLHEEQDEQCFADTASKRLPSSKAYYHLRSSAAGGPRLSGLPKDVPLHPIVSFVSSPTYTLSKLFVSLLSLIVSLSDCHVRNSQQFAQFSTTQNKTISLCSSASLTYFSHQHISAYFMLCHYFHRLGHYPCPPLLHPEYTQVIPLTAFVPLFTIIIFPLVYS